MTDNLSSNGQDIASALEQDRRKEVEDAKGQYKQE
jgi:hypothetical protein